MVCGDHESVLTLVPVGNTETVCGYKTRRYENIRAEVEAFFDVHAVRCCLSYIVYDGCIVLDCPPE